MARLLPALLATAALFCVPASNVAGALYKWVDEDGNIRYSDQLPPSQSSKKHQKLNASGVVVTTREAAKSDEELAADAEARRLAEEKAAEDGETESRLAFYPVYSTVPGISGTALRSFIRSLFND